jgi:hypothetical protein
MEIIGILIAMGGTVADYKNITFFNEVGFVIDLMHGGTV